MSLSGLKQLFLVGFLGLTLVGCSSTPSSEDGSSDSSNQASSNASGSNGSDNSGSASANGANGGSAGAGSEMAAKTNAAGQTADELMAALQGKVVNFDFDRDEVKSEFYNVIRMNADYMALNTNATVTIKVIVMSVVHVNTTWHWVSVVRTL